VRTSKLTLLPALLLLSASGMAQQTGPAAENVTPAPAPPSAPPAYPCEHGEKFREFDFWLGEWGVRTADGRLAGHNSIRPAERGCLLTEHWTNTSGGTGMSINYFDKVANKWVQVWLAEGGSQIMISGGMTDEGMSLLGTLHDIGSGSTVPFRGLWTPLADGRVRQYFEQSNDGGVTWVPWFEGFYSRVEKN
jgi:hypothetical protein